MATTEQCKKFIAEIVPLMQSEAKARGYRICSTAIAQACIESAYGTSSLGYKYHNYFGMKCGSKWQGKSVNLKTKEEYTIGTLTSISANFRAYDSIAEGVKGYYDFISSARYKNLLTARTPKEYAEMLKQDGYATSSTYINTLVTTVAKWNLDQYDFMRNYQPILRKGDKGEDVKMLQKALNKNGYNLTVDGIFGTNTYNAVVAFQGEKGITKDGIVGNITWSCFK